MSNSGVYSAGTAFLQVTPSFVNIDDAFKDQLREMGRRIEGQVSSATRAASKNAKRAGKDAGEDYSGAFGKEVLRDLEKAWKSIPVPQPGDKFSAWDKALGKLRKEMQELSKEKIGFTIDEKTAFKAIKNMRREAQRLQDAAPSGRGFFDAREAGGSLDNLIGKIDDAKSRGRAAGEQYGGAFTDGLNRTLQKGLGAIRPVKVKADTSDAERDLQKVRAAMNDLSSKTIGVDISAEQAMADLRRLEDKLSDLDNDGVDIRVRVEAREAAAGMREFRTSADGSAESVRNIDRAASLTMSRLQYLIALSASLGSVMVPAAAAAAGAVGLITTAAIAGGAAVGVFALGISGISDAVKALNAQSADQEKNQNSINQAQRAAVGTTDSLRQSQLALANTRRTVRQGEEDAARAVQEAVADVARTRRDEGVAAREAAQGVADAQRSVTRAEVDAREARDALNVALREARADLDDLTTALTRNSTDQQKAVTEQMAALNELNALKANPRATEVEIRRAKDAYDEQTTRLLELRDKRREINEEQEKRARLGVEGDQKVISARDRVAAADQRVADARERRDRVKQSADEQAVKSSERVADAESRVADARRAKQRQQAQGEYQLVTAQAAVTSAARQQQDAFERVGTAGGESMDKLDKAMAGLTPTGQRFARFIFGLRDEALALRAAASDPMLPGLQTAIEMLLPYLPGFAGFIGRIAAELGNMAVRSVEALGHPVWKQFFKYIDRSAVPTLQLMFESGMNVARGLTSLYLALTPFNESAGAGLLKLSEDFAMWAERLDKSQGYEDFLEYVRENGPRVLDFLGSLGTLVVRLVEALAPMGVVALESLDAIVDGLNAIPMPILTILVSLLGAVAIGIIGIGAALRAAKFKRELAEVFGASQRRHLDNYADATGRNVTQMSRYQRTVSTVGGAAITARGHLAAMGRSTATAFSGRYVSMVGRYGTAVGFAATQTARIRGAMSTAGGAARTAAGRFSTAAGAMGALRSGAGSLAGFLGGPWGVALVAATVAIGYFTQKSADQKAKVESLKSALGELSKTYQDLGGKGVEAGAKAEQAFRDVVANNPDLQKAVVTLNDLGLSFDQIVNAATSGNPADVIAAIDAEMRRLGEEMRTPGNFFQIFDNEKRADRIDELAAMKDGFVANAEALGLASNAQRVLNSETERSLAMAAIQNSNVGATAAQLGVLATQWDRNQTRLSILNRTLLNFGDNAEAARRRADDLSAAIDRQYGSAIKANEATEDWSGKLLELRDSAESNGKSLDINSRAGLANRDAIQAAAQASRELFIEEVAAGGELPKVTKKHNDRITSLKEEARKTFGANKEAAALIVTYGEIDPSITTKYTTAGFDKVYKEAQQLKFAQTMLELGITDPAEAEGMWNRQQATAQGLLPPSSGYGGQKPAPQRKAVGGPIIGTGTGVSDTELILASPGEHMITKEEVVAAGGHDQVLAWRRAILAGATVARHAKGGPIMKSGLPAYKGGGIIAPMIVNLLGTKLPSMAEAEDTIRRKQLGAGLFDLAGGAQAVAGWSAEQVRNAMGIVSAGKSMGLPSRAWLIALATAMQESTLRNLGHLGARNDHDSQGLFQQRPSQGWGTPEQVRNVTYASRSFYRRLMQVPDWQTLPVTRAAQRVQRSAYPNAYAKWEDDAQRLLAAITSGAAAGGSGTLGGTAPTGRGWQWQIGTLRKMFPDVDLYSAVRKGARTRSGQISRHALGLAVDVSPWQRVFNYIHDTFGGSTRELIWGGDPSRNIYHGKHHRFSDGLLRDHGPFRGEPGPSPHIHWSFDEGGWLMPGAGRVVNATGKPEPVLNPSQWAAVEDQNSIMRRLVSDVNSVGGRSGSTFNFEFANTTLDESRLQVIRQREEAMERAGRPY